MEKLKFSCIDGRTINGAASVEVLGFRFLYTNIHSSIIHRSQKVEKTQRPSTDEWINKMWHIHTMDHSAIESDEILIHAIQHG